MNARPIIAALLAAALTLLFVSGCAPRERIVSVPCVEQASIPPETQKPVLTGNAVADVMVMLDTILALRNETGDLRALLKGCVN